MAIKSKFVSIKFDERRNWFAKFSKDKNINYLWFPVENYLYDKDLKFHQEFIAYRIFKGISHAHHL